MSTKDRSCSNMFTKSRETHSLYVIDAHDKLSIRFGEILVAEDGWVSPTYKEADGATYMKRQRLNLNVDLGLGTGQATVWTCDLTQTYIQINADYRS